MPLRDLLIRFIDFLRNFHCPKLVAHNAQCFDVPVLMRVLAKNGLQQQFMQVVPYYVDTLQLSRRRNHDLPDGHSLKALAKYYLGRNFDEHNALEDAKILQMLFYNWNLAEFYISRSTFPFISYS